MRARAWRRASPKQSGTPSPPLQCCISGAAHAERWHDAPPFPAPARRPPMQAAPQVKECPESTSATTCNAGLCNEAESDTEVNGACGARAHGVSVRARTVACNVRWATSSAASLMLGAFSSPEPTPGFEACSREQAKRRGAPSSGLRRAAVLLGDQV